MSRVTFVRAPLSRGTVAFRARVMADESYASLKRILKHEAEVRVVRGALKLVEHDDAKKRLLMKKIVILVNKEKVKGE